MKQEVTMGNNKKIDHVIGVFGFLMAMFILLMSTQMSAAIIEMKIIIDAPGYTNYCINVQYNPMDPTNGGRYNPLHLWNNSNVPTDYNTWLYNTETGVIKLKCNPAFCINMVYGYGHPSFGDGNPLHLWDNSNTETVYNSWDIQKTPDGKKGRIVSRYYPSQCLNTMYPFGVYPYPYGNGNPMHMWNTSNIYSEHNTFHCLNFHVSKDNSFRFVATADPQYGYQTESANWNYPEQADETYWTVFNYMNANNINVLTVSGDLNHEDRGISDYGAMFKYFVDNGGKTVIDCRGNHDTSDCDHSERSYYQNSRVRYDLSTRNVVYSEWHTSEYKDCYYYAHKVQSTMGPVYMVSLGDTEGTCGDFMGRFMDGSQPVVNYGAYQRTEPFDSNIPIIIIKHRNADSNALTISDSLKQEITNSSVVAVIYGHQHISHHQYHTGVGPYYISNSTGAFDSTANYFPIDWYDAGSAISNKWGGNIKILNAAAAFAGVYWVVTLTKNWATSGYYFNTEKRNADVLCYTDENQSFHPYVSAPHYKYFYSNQL